MRLVLLIACLATAGSAQVKVTLPKNHFRVREEIPAKIENHTHHDIAFCVEYGQWSPAGKEVKSTPLPFAIQRQSDTEWQSLMMGPDIGSKRLPLKLESGKSVEFPFRLNEAGTLRLRLDYWKASAEDVDCPHPETGKRTTWSRPFLQD